MLKYLFDDLKFKMYYTEICRNSDLFLNLCPVKIEFSMAK